MSLAPEQIIAGLEAAVDGLLEDALTEGYGSLYHATSLRAFTKIVYDDLFELSYGRGDVEQALSSKPFFASFSRVPANRFRRGSAVTMVVDGDQLRQRYRLAPVDYWGFGAEGSESEERLTSNAPEIKEFKKYLQAVHVYYHDNSQASEYDLLTYLKVPVYVYRDRDAYFLLDTRKALSPEDFIASLPAPEPQIPFSRTDSDRFLLQMDGLLDFLEGGGKKHLKPWHDRLFYYHDDFVIQMDNEVHNFRSRKGLPVRKMWLRWEALLKAYGATTIRGFAKAFINQHGRQVRPEKPAKRPSPRQSPPQLAGTSTGAG